MIQLRDGSQVPYSIRRYGRWVQVRTQVGEIEVEVGGEGCPVKSMTLTSRGTFGLKTAERVGQTWAAALDSLYDLLGRGAS